MLKIDWPAILADTRKNIKSLALLTFLPLIMKAAGYFDIKITAISDLGWVELILATLSLMFLGLFVRYRGLDFIRFK